MTDNEDDDDYIVPLNEVVLETETVKRGMVINSDGARVKKGQLGTRIEFLSLLYIDGGYLGSKWKRKRRQQGVVVVFCPVTDVADCGDNLYT